MDVQKLKNFKSVFKYFGIFVEKKQAVDDERDVRVDSFTCFQDIFRSTNIIFCYISELSLLDFKNYEKGLYYKNIFFSDSFLKLYLRDDLLISFTIEESVFRFNKIF